MRYAITYFMLWIGFVGSSLAAAPTEVTFGVTPQHSASELAKLWGPICQYLSKRTGYHVLFKTSKDLDAFWADTGNGIFDIVYINPPRYVSAHANAGYHVFAKDGDSPLIGIIVARKDGPESVEALQGKTLAVPSLSSLGAAQMPQAYLKGKGIDVALAPVNSHDSVYRTIEKGLFSAGASNLRIFGMLKPEEQAQFRVLWKSDPLPPFAYAAHPRVARTTVETLRRALQQMDGDAEGRALLAAVNVKAIVAAKDSEYDSVRKLKLE